MQICLKEVNKRGISLIVLIVTIIVIIILAAVVALTITKNNPIENAKEAAFKEDVRTFQDELSLTISKEYTDTQGKRTKKIDAKGKDIKKYIPDLKDEYVEKFEIVEDELKYIDDKFNEKEIKWLSDLNISEKERVYVKDGLILYYDGINNTRNGNNPETLVWEDLSGNNNDAKFINPNNTIKYKENGYEFTNNSDYIESINNLDLSSDPDVTFEFAYKWYGFQTNHNMAGFFSLGSSSTSDGKSLTAWISKGNGYDFSSVNSSVITKAFPIENNIYTVDFIKKSGKTSIDNLLVYENSVLKNNVENKYSVSMNLQNTPIQIGRMWQWGGQNRTLNGIIYSVRVYNRVLSEDEIKQNYEVDKLRFNLK